MGFRACLPTYKIITEYTNKSFTHLKLAVYLVLYHVVYMYTFFGNSDIIITSYLHNHNNGFSPYPGLQYDLKSYKTVKSLHFITIVFQSNGSLKKNKNNFTSLSVQVNSQTTPRRFFLPTDFFFFLIADFLSHQLTETIYITLQISVETRLQIVQYVI